MFSNILRIVYSNTTNAQMTYFVDTNNCSERHVILVADIELRMNEVLSL
jgi:hypothetical protein